MDGSLITGLRTGASGAVSVKVLARKNAKKITSIGTGNQARMQIRAINEVMKIEEIHAWNNNPDTLSKYKTDIESEFGIPVVMANSKKEAVEQADILITTTRGKGSLVEADWVKPGTVATLDFPLLHSQREWEHGMLPPSLNQAQADIKWAEHIVLLFPLWLGDMPALLKGFLEQVARPGFAFSRGSRSPLTGKGLTGRSARLVVTMGMPASVYRWYFRAHSLKSLERNILGFVGIAPVSKTLIGMAGNVEPETAGKWLSKLEKFGERGD
jgi:putative NADPH-quinone reductase